MNTQIKEQTEHLEFELLRKPNCVVELKIESDPKLALKAEERALRAVAKEVSIPGFRKGKAPTNLLRKHYPKAVEDESKKKLTQLALEEVQAKIQTSPLNRETPINFSMDTFSTKEKISFTISFESEPQVPAIKLDELKFEEAERPEITEERVEAGVRDILLVYADWKEVKERGVKEGDYVLLDIEDIETNPPEKVFSSIRFEVREKRMAKWMRDLAIGLKTGEAKDGLSEPDDHLTEEEKREFKVKKVRLTVTRIEEAHLPPLDEAFCKKVGAKDEEAFRAHVKEVLGRHAEEFAVKKERDQISKRLVEASPFDVPASLIQKETHYRLRSLLSDPKFLKDWQKMSEDERKKAVEEMKEEATRAICLFYLCRQVVQDANIEISQEEITRQLDSESSKDEDQALIYSRLTLEKAQDHLIATLKK